MKSVDELNAIRDKMQSQMAIRTHELDQTKIVVGMGTRGIDSDTKSVLNTLSDLILEKGLSNVSVTQTDCIGLCQYEPLVEVIKAGEEKVTYVNMTADKVKEVVDKHIIMGEIVKKYTMPQTSEEV